MLILDLHKSVRAVPIVVLDLEMTGLDFEQDRICEVAFVRREVDGTIRHFESLVLPDCPMSESARRVHGLSLDDLASAPPFSDIATDVQHMLSGALVVGHHVAVDWYFLSRELVESGEEIDEPVLMDTLEMSRRLFAFPQNDLASVAERLDVVLENAHRAMGDARATYEIFFKMIELTDPEGELCVEEWSELIKMLAPRSSLREFQQRVLREAFRRKVSVLIDYLSSSHPLDGVVKREIDIWKLRLPKIHGWCHLRQGERVFRSERIRRVKIGDRGYQVPRLKG